MHLTPTPSNLFSCRCLIQHAMLTSSASVIKPIVPNAKPISLNTLPATSMRAWVIQAYNSPLVQTEIALPKLKRDDQVLLRVMAASINPIDIRICEGYGRELLALQKHMGWNDQWYGIPDPRRIFYAIARQASEISGSSSAANNQDVCFPMVPGRDCSAEVVEVGGRVQSVEVGDQVIAVIPPEWQGTHADYVIAAAYALAPKPASIGHTEAASLPYAACTAWTALVTAARIKPDNANGVRVLINGGAGGVGSMAIQMLRCWGAEHVVATCSTKKLEFVEQLGAKAVDYGDEEEAKHQIISNGPYEIVLDCVPNSKFSEWSDQVLGIWRNCMHITLNSPLLEDTDRYGLAMGMASTGAKMLCNNIKFISKGQLLLPAFFAPNPECLNWVSQAVQEGRLQPVIDEVFPFADLPKAFEKVRKMHGKGKTVVNFAQ